MSQPRPIPASVKARLPRLPAALVLAAAGALLAACGGSGSPSSPNAAAKEQAAEQKAETKLADFARCLREHGIHANLTSQPSGGHSLEIGPGSAGFAGAGDAQQACARYRPAPQKTNVSAQQRVEQEETQRKFVKCMRSHGVPNFPEPKAVVGPGGGEGAYLAGVNLGSPAVQAAAKDCGGGPKGP